MPSFKEKVLESYPDAICVEVEAKTYAIHSNSSEVYSLLGYYHATEEQAWESAFIEIEEENEPAAEDEEYDDDWSEDPLDEEEDEE